MFKRPDGRDACHVRHTETSDHQTLMHPRLRKWHSAIELVGPHNVGTLHQTSVLNVHGLRTAIPGSIFHHKLEIQQLLLQDLKH